MVGWYPPAHRVVRRWIAHTLPQHRSSPATLTQTHTQTLTHMYAHTLGRSPLLPRVSASRRSSVIRKLGGGRSPPSARVLPPPSSTPRKRLLYWCLHRHHHHHDPFAPATVHPPPCSPRRQWYARSPLAYTVYYATLHRRDTLRT